MVLFGRPAPPVQPLRESSPHHTPENIEPPNLKGPPDLIIPPQFRKYCFLGFGVQVVLDILVILIIFFRPGAFFTIPVACVCLVLDFAMMIWTHIATPRPIDVLMKNALSGVAWFMLTVINGAIIAESKNPYPPFIICLFTFIINTVFWCWTVWWGLNDRGPRSMYPQQRAKRCFSCRNGGGMFNIHTHAHIRRPSMPGNFSPTDGSIFGGSGIAMGPLSRQPTAASRLKEALPPASPVHRGGSEKSLQPREEPTKIRTLPSFGVRGHQSRKESFASTCFTDGDFIENHCDNEGSSSPV